MRCCAWVLYATFTALNAVNIGGVSMLYMVWVCIGLNAPIGAYMLASVAYSRRLACENGGKFISVLRCFLGRSRCCVVFGCHGNRLSVGVFCFRYWSNNR